MSDDPREPAFGFRVGHVNGEPVFGVANLSGRECFAPIAISDEEFRLLQSNWPALGELFAARARFARDTCRNWLEHHHD
jgi:hypothetical protein